jgi:hypothetical protein
MTGNGMSFRRAPGVSEYGSFDDALHSQAVVRVSAGLSITIGRRSSGESGATPGRSAGLQLNERTSITLLIHNKRQRP